MAGRSANSIRVLGIHSRQCIFGNVTLQFVRITGTFTVFPARFPLVVVRAHELIHPFPIPTHGRATNPVDIKVSLHKITFLQSIGCLAQKRLAQIGQAMLLVPDRNQI